MTSFEPKIGVIYAGGPPGSAHYIFKYSEQINEEGENISSMDYLFISSYNSKPVIQRGFRLYEYYEYREATSKECSIWESHIGINYPAKNDYYDIF